MNTLKRDWQPTHGLRHILMVIRCLLIEPFPESAERELENFCSKITMSTSDARMYEHSASRRKPRPDLWRALDSALVARRKPRKRN